MNRKPTYKQLEQRIVELEKIAKKKNDSDFVYHLTTNSVIILDLERNIISANSAAEKLFKTPESNLLNKKCYDVFNKLGRKFTSNVCPCQISFQGAAAKTIETEIKLQNEYFLVSCIPAMNEQGQLERIIHVTTNVTELKKNEEKAFLLLEAARAIPLSLNFNDAAKKIYDICKGHLGVASGYISLKSDTGKKDDLIFMDDGGHLFFLEPSLPSPIKELKDLALRTGEVSYSNDFLMSPDGEHMPTMAIKNILYAPLIFGDKVAGVIGLANKPQGFNEYDLEVAKAFGEIAALALKHSAIKEDLFEREEFCSKLIDGSPNPILVMDEHRAVTYVNKAFEKLSGYSVEEVAGMKPPFPWWTEDTIEKTRADLEKAMKNGSISVEEKYQNKSGEIFYVEITSAPIMRGKILNYYLKNWVDITKKKVAENTLKETQDMFMKAFKTAPCMIAISKIEDGTMIEMNDAFINSTGYEKDYTIGKTSVELGFIKKEDRESLLKKIIDYGYARHVELTVYRHDKSPITCLYSGELIELNGITRLLSTSIDITERKRQEDLLKHKQSELKAYSKKLEEMNTALNVLIDHRGEEKEAFKKDTLKNFEKLVFPYFPAPKDIKTKEELSTILSILERNIKEIILRGCGEKNASLYLELTPMEAQIAHMIQTGNSSKDIAGRLNLSVRTIYFHRENIRRKLNLTKTKTTLKAYLQSQI